MAGPSNPYLYLTRRLSTPAQYKPSVQPWPSATTHTDPRQLSSPSLVNFIMAKIAVAVYSTYGHILSLAKAEAEGAKAAGAQVDVFQLPSGEPHDASASSDLPVMTPSLLAEYDGFLFGVPSRYGTHPYAFKAFFDATGAQWAQGAYDGKYGSFFVTSGTQGGGQESVVRNSISILVHHGIIYVPLGYAPAFGELTSLNEVHGGSPWGAGSFAGPSGSRQPSEVELKIAHVQGEKFAETVLKSTKGSKGAVASTSTSKEATTGSTDGTTGVSTGASETDKDASSKDGSGAAAGVGAAGAAGAAGATAAGVAGSAKGEKGAAPASGPGASATGASATGASATGASATGAPGSAPGDLKSQVESKAGDLESKAKSGEIPKTDDLKAQGEQLGSKAKSGDIPKADELKSGDLPKSADGIKDTAQKQAAGAESEAKDAATNTAEKAKGTAPEKGDVKADDVKDSAAKAEKEAESGGCCKCM